MTLGCPLAAALGCPLAEPAPREVTLGRRGGHSGPRRSWLRTAGGTVLSLCFPWESYTKRCTWTHTRNVYLRTLGRCPRGNSVFAPSEVLSSTVPATTLDKSPFTSTPAAGVVPAANGLALVIVSTAAGRRTGRGTCVWPRGCSRGVVGVGRGVLPLRRRPRRRRPSPVFVSDGGGRGRPVAPEPVAAAAGSHPGRQRRRLAAVLPTGRRRRPPEAFVRGPARGPAVGAAEPATRRRSSRA